MSGEHRHAKVTISSAPAAMVACCGRTASMAAGNYAEGVSRVDLGCWCVISGLGGARWGSA